MYFYQHHKFFKSQSISCIFDGVINKATVNPFSNMLKWLGCADRICNLKGWHDFIKKATFSLNKVGKDYEAKVMPSWDALVLHCKRANYVLNMVLSAKGRQCSTLGNIEEYGWTNSEKIVVNWGKPEQRESNTTGCGCHSGCDTKRCSCYSERKPCNHKCRCTNCINTSLVENKKKQNYNHCSCHNWGRQHERRQ